MLCIKTEYKKGVLFVRLDGRSDNEGYLNKINWLIEEIGIKFTVLNITHLNDITRKTIDNIVSNIKLQRKKKHHLLICDENRLRNIYVKSIPKLSNETEAFSFIERKDVYE